MRFAHIALWRKLPEEAIGIVILAPNNDEFAAEVSKLAGARYDRDSQLAVFDLNLRLEAYKLLDKHFPRQICSICAPLRGTCNFWNYANKTGTSHGYLLMNPSTESAEPSNALTRISQVSPTLRTVLESGRPVTTATGTTQTRPRPARAPEIRISNEVTAPGTVRCATCGQVIPPGFNKSKDAQKTVDEIYDACQHVFDAERVCLVCHQKERRDESRFSLLEID